MRDLVKRVLDYANRHKDEVSVLIYSEVIVSDIPENEAFLRTNGLVWNRISIDKRIAKFNRVSFKSFVASQIGGVQW